MTQSERMKQLWRDPAARRKMLAGSRKGAQARREVDQRTRAEHSYRCRRAQSERFKKQ